MISCKTQLSDNPSESSNFMMDMLRCDDTHRKACTGEYKLHVEWYISITKEQLSTLLETAQAGDTILTLEVSRLAGSTKQLCEIIETVKDKCLRLSIVGSVSVDCSSGQIDPMTNAFIQISGVFAELELRIIRDRVRSGMANAGVKWRKDRQTAHYR